MTKTYELGGELRMPALGLGTWQAEPGVVGDAVREAIRLGYRHFDCARIYGNEAEIGAALSMAIDAGEVRREDLWITSKLWNDCHGRENVIPALRRTLDDLQLEYVDLYLVHWPLPQRPGITFPGGPEDFLPADPDALADTWAGMEAAAGAGLARCIGVSNFDVGRMEALSSRASIPPRVLQVELHPYLAQRALVEWCHSHGVLPTAYSPLGSRGRPARLRRPEEPSLLADPVITAIADRHDATPAQVLIAWGIRRGTSVIPKSANPDRLRENIAATELVLDDADMEAIQALDRGFRYIDGSFWCFPGSPHTLESLWG
jgi:alcohol dehydrogenase (NADP+)